MIGEKGDILAMGRSGTGKTTCALLRLFSTEVLFKIRGNFITKEILKGSAFSAENMDDTYGLHSVFVTASPVLTNEVRRYYERLKEKIKTELVKRDQRRARNNAELIDADEVSEMSEENKEPVQTLEEAFEELKNVEEELEMLDANEIEKQLSMKNSLNSIPDSEFPLFLTIRRLLIMLDGTFHNHFFVRDRDGRVIGLNESAEWHDEEGGVMMIDLSHKFMNIDLSESTKMEKEDYEKMMKVLESNKEEDEGDELDDFEFEKEAITEEGVVRETVHNKPFMAKEVNFEIFRKRFWPTILGKIQFKKKSITEAMAWREIQTYIKGSVLYHTINSAHAGLASYLENPNGLKEYGARQERRMYRIYSLYQKWCESNCYFDMGDLVNHLLKLVNRYGYRGTPIHFFMCDEVQDLTPATLLLLIRITDRNIFFSGDTAQTISKGVEFRFSDLKRLFEGNDMRYMSPLIMQLSVNFRSHGRILDLANSIIRILELFYPHSIDKLEKERSPLDGIKPIVLGSELKETLINLLLFSQKKVEAEAQERSTIEFGCDQVIIVRNQQAKERLPKLLKHALCLTVYEAKGLEFDDVILYNFFADSEAEAEWKLVDKLIIEDVKVKKSTIATNTVEQLSIKDEFIAGGTEELKEGDYEVLKNVRMKALPRSVQKTNASFVSELKHLYTAVTRPRKRLIIFDEDVDTRKAVLEYWCALGYVTVLDEEELGNESLSGPVKQLAETLTGRNTSKAGWRAQGMKMFRRKYYEQAMKCFENSGDEEFCIHAEGYLKASRGSELLAEINTVKYEMKENATNKGEKRKAIARINELSGKAWREFNKAAETFERLGKHMRAAQCYFTAQEYEKAARCFALADCPGQAAEACMKLGHYLEAGELYEKANIPSNAIIAYEHLRDWDKILDCIHRFKSEFKDEDRKSLVRKYIELELQKIFREYEDANNKSREEKGEEELPMIEERLAEQISCEDSGIEEAISLATDNAYPKESTVLDNSVATNPFEELNKSEVSGAANPFEESNASRLANPFEDVDEPLSDGEDNGRSKADPEDEFSLVDVSHSRQSKIPLDFEQYSEIDPDDEWLRCETGSIVDSVVSGKVSASNRDSDYSLLDNAHAFIVNSNLLNTKRDIFIEDVTMSKIIKYVSYFSEEVRGYLENQRSKEALLHTSSEESDHKSPSEFIFDMDEIDLPLVNLILDTLESMEFEKLCIVICNRYQINERLGRYVMAVGNRYSNMKYLHKNFNGYAEAFSHYTVSMQSNISIIANKALHGVLEVINPAYLKLKKYGEMVDDNNSLGRYCYRSLMLLGYWKKLVYIMDCQNSLAITSSFGDYINYKMVYLLNFGKLTKENAAEMHSLAKACSFEWLPFESPSNSLEAHALSVALDSILFELNRVHKFFYVHSGKGKSTIKECPKFPPEFPCCSSLWKYLFTRNDEDLFSIYTALDSGARSFLFDRTSSIRRELAIRDFCIALTYLIFGISNVAVQNVFLKYPPYYYNTLLQAVYQVLGLLRNKQTYRGQAEEHYIAYLALLSAFGVRRFEGRDCQIGYGNLFVMHRSSILFELCPKINQSVANRERESILREAEDFIEGCIPNTDPVLKRELLGEIIKIIKLRKDKEFEDTTSICFADLEAEYVFLFPELLLDVITNEMVHNIVHVSYARLPEICKMPTTKSLTREVWEYTSHEELRKEAREIALRVGEIGFTLRVIERIRAQKGGEGESDICAKYLFYADLLDSTSENEIKIKKKKKRFGSTENELNIELSQLFFKLQVLSVVLFGEGKPAHANSEDWVIELIQGVVALAMKSNDEDTFEKIFPIACCYFSIGRRDLFVEQANSLFRTSRKDVGCMLTTWLNAVETYRTHCLDECFWHLLQFFEDGREVVNKQGEKIRSFNEFVQLLIAEKIIGLGIILLNSTKGKSSMQLAKNILKHFSFAKTERDRYTLDVFMREDCSQEKEDAIRSSCRNVLSQVVKSIDSIISGKMKRMYLKNTQMLLMTMLLNAKDKDEIALLKEMYVQMVPKFISGVKAMIKEEMWEENESVRTSCCENDIYPTIIPIELVHNEDCAPNTEQLKKEELRQYKQMATRSRIYRALKGRKVNRRFVQELKVPFDREKCEIANEARSLGYVLSAEEIAKASNTKSVKDAYDLLKKVKGMHMILLNSFYTIKIYNTLDAHYLFTLIERVDGYYTNAIKIFGGAAAGKKETLAVSAREIEENLEKIKKDLLAWKDYIFVPDKKYIEERKAINKLKWIQSSKKKQIIKKGAIKPKVGGFRSGNLKGKVKSILDKFNKAFNI